MYSRIILAYDGTVEGATALREGALLAKRCDAQVFILSVVPENAGARFAEGVQAGAVAHQMKSYKALLERGLTRLEQLGLKPVGRLVVGEPAREIGRFAKEVRADLVVVGHRRQSMLERWWSGPSGTYISDYIGCSLLVARNEISDEAFEAELRATTAP